MTNNGRIFCLVVTLAASAALLIASPGPRLPPATPTVAQAWPAAQRDTRSAYLPDGTAYQPGVFLDARTSIGSAPSRDGKYMRLVIRGAGDAVHEVRRIPLTRKPSFVSPTVAGDVLVWVENTRAGRQLWTAGLPTGRAARLLTGDTGTDTGALEAADRLATANRALTEQAREVEEREAALLTLLAKTMLH